MNLINIEYTVVAFHSEPPMEISNAFSSESYSKNYIQNEISVTLLFPFIKKDWLITRLAIPSVVCDTGFERLLQGI